jgi:putative NIF3 family GTP cyclohydrolase 1 type 2
MVEMKLIDIYKLAVQMGMDADLRTREEIEVELKRVGDRFKKMEAADQDLFEKDQMWNPYADSRILNGDPSTDVKGILWGIDIGTGEIVLADRLREKGRQIDAAISHHPNGYAHANFYEVMHVQEALMQQAGISINVAEDIVSPRIREVRNAIASSNHEQTVDAARLLNMPFMCIHQPTDILVQRFLEKLMEEKRPERVEDVLKALSVLPEMRFAIKHNNPPEVWVGDRSRHAGKISVKMCGGTAYPKDVYEKLAQAGVGTVICMHVPESHIEEARKNHINIIISGHMASDSLGVNLFADKVEQNGVEITPCSGLIRIKRSAN